MLFKILKDANNENRPSLFFKVCLIFSASESTGFAKVAVVTKKKLILVNKYVWSLNETNLN